MKKVAEECIFSVVLWLPRTYFLEVHPGHLWQKADSNYLQIFMLVRHTKLIIHLLQTEVSIQRSMKNKTEETTHIKECL